MFNNSGDAHVIADVVGYFTPTSGGVAMAVAPKRLLDSRNGTGGFTTPWAPGQTRELTVTGGSTSVPTTATAVVLNLTGVSPTAATHITVWPAGQPRPMASNLNLPPGDTRPNLVVVKVGTEGKIALFNNSGNTHLIADVVGYYT